MSLLSELRKARTDSAQVAYQDFVLHTRVGIEGLFCFFEGKGGTDNPYYIPRIKQFINQYHPIRCGGRDKVLKVYDLIKIHPEYDKYKKAFFIDKDFNKPLAIRNPPIFETEYYSVENFYVSEIVFSEILKNVLNINEINASYKVCMELFRSVQKEFHESTLLFNSWYACLIDIRNDEGKLTGVTLDKKMPAGFIIFSLNKITSNYDLDKIRLTFPDALEVDDEKLSEKIQEFSKVEQYKVFRGKFEMEFLLKFIEMLIYDSLREQKIIKHKVTLPFGSTISNDQAISIFSGYAETPEKLVEYLTEVVR